MIRDIDSPTFARDVARRVHRGRRALVLKSLKGKGGELRVESGLERDVGLMLDIDPRVSELAAQPFTLELQSNSVLPSRQDYLKRPGVKPRFYTPDFLCRLDDGSVLAIEAKHSRFWTPPFRLRSCRRCPACTCSEQAILSHFVPQRRQRSAPCSTPQPAGRSRSLPCA
jgi:hypothetical protein